MPNSFSNIPQCHGRIKFVSEVNQMPIKIVIENLKCRQYITVMELKVT